MVWEVPAKLILRFEKRIPPMAQKNVKTEMKGTTSRWVTRAEAKSASKKIRRALDKKLAQERS